MLAQVTSNFRHKQLALLSSGPSNVSIHYEKTSKESSRRVKGSLLPSSIHPLLIPSRVFDCIVMYLRRKIVFRHRVFVGFGVSVRSSM